MPLSNFSCLDCQKNVLKKREYSYMVLPKLWKQVVGKREAGKLCISCFEKRLRRKLNSYDFDWNMGINWFHENQSRKLLNRLYKEGKS